MIGDRAQVDLRFFAHEIVFERVESADFGIHDGFEAGAIEPGEDADAFTGKIIGFVEIELRAP